MSKFTSLTLSAALLSSLALPAMALGVQPPAHATTVAKSRVLKQHRGVRHVAASPADSVVRTPAVSSAPIASVTAPSPLAATTTPAPLAATTTPAVTTAKPAVAASVPATPAPAMSAPAASPMTDGKLGAKPGVTATAPSVTTAVPAMPAKPIVKIN